MHFTALSTSNIHELEEVEPGYLHGTMTVQAYLPNGKFLTACDLHVYLIEVTDGELGGVRFQEARHPEQMQRFAELSEHDPGRFETLTIDGRSFCVFATPYHD